MINCGKRDNIGTCGIDCIRIDCCEQDAFRKYKTRAEKAEAQLAAEQTARAESDARVLALLEACGMALLPAIDYIRQGMVEEYDMVREILAEIDPTWYLLQVGLQ